MNDHESKFIILFSDIKSFPYTPEYVKLVQTHISIIAIAPPYVFKAKKNLKLNFLDYSTVEKRLYYLKQELLLNQRLTENIYLEVVPVYINNDKLTFEKIGELYDHTLKLHFLNPLTNLVYLLENDLFSETHLDLLIDRLTDFYMHQTPVKQIQEFGKPDHIIKIITDNLDELFVFSGQIFPKRALDAIGYFTNQCFQKKSPVFQDRYAKGYTKDCHGDLRMEHIYIEDSSVQIYDCIEFNDDFRYIDVMEDIAFLAMELDYFDYTRLSNELCIKLLKQMDDSTGSEVLVFYKLYRALVRAKVNCILSSETEVENSKQKAALQTAKKFLLLAMRYIISNNEPFVIIVMGKIASGKSTISHIIANDLGIHILSTDEIRKKKAKLDIYQETPEDIKKVIYSAGFTNEVYEDLLNEADVRLITDRAVILDGTFSKSSYREKICHNFKDNRIIFVELTSSEASTIARLQEREFTKSNSDARLKDKQTLQALYEPVLPIPGSTFISLVNEGDPETTVREIYRKMAECNLNAQTQ